jgi:predicted RNA binding protein YcfA (HicA-like mRNA interferase family)
MSKMYSSREIIRLLEDDGWYEVRVTGSHHHFKHMEKSGIVTLPHPKKHIGKGLLNSILKQAKLKEEYQS